MSSIYFELFIFCFVGFVLSAKLTLLFLLLESCPCTLCVSIGLDTFEMGSIVLLNPGCVSLLVIKPDFFRQLDLKEFFYGFSVSI